jgi:hypothetical protein
LKIQRYNTSTKHLFTSIRCEVLGVKKSTHTLEVSSIGPITSLHVLAPGASFSEYILHPQQYRTVSAVLLMTHIVAVAHCSFSFLQLNSRPKKPANRKQKAVLLIRSVLFVLIKYRFPLLNMQ